MNLKYILITLLTPLFCIGQNQKKIDSLEGLIKNSKSFHDKDQFDSAYHYAKISYDFAKQIDADSLQVEIVGILSYFEPDLQKALSYLTETEPLAIKNKQWKYLENIYHARGAIYYHRTQDESALFHFLKLDSLLNVRKDDIFLAAMTKENIVKILHESISVNDTSFLPQMNKNIKDGLKIINDGLKISKDSLKFYNAYYLNVPAAILYEKKAYVNTLRNEPQKAIINYKKALDNTISNDNQLRKSSIYNGLANLYNKENLLDSALYYYKKELKAINKTADTLRKAIANYKIAEFYTNNKEPKIALTHLKTSQALMKNAFFVREENKYEIQYILASTYFNLGDTKKAFKASEKARQHLITIQTEFNKKNVSELETKYQTEKKEQEITLLKSEKELNAQKQKTQQNLFYGGFVLATLAGLFLFFLYRNRQKTNNKLRELDKVKSNFFANISHEFRTPLTLITNPIDEALEDESLSDKKRNQFIMAKRNSDRLLSLVNQLLDLSKIDAGQLKLKIQKGNVHSLISGLGESFNYTARQNNINYDLHIEKSNHKVWFDKDALEKITVNLLSNAIKYTPENGSVICKSYIEKDTLHLIVKNTGVGLTKKELDNIFTRFYQTDEENQGTGIGLALVKELVELQKGTINADSNSNNEISFSVAIPVNQQSFKNETCIDSSEIKTTYKESFLDEVKVIEEEFKDNDKPILLIVEDNTDVRILLKQTFEDDYNILTAKNGQIGIDLAFEQIPDIIISDIMMPIKDGVGLTKTLKNSELTSHIPIILLTAKAGDENEIKGIKIGADDYIIKPFNSKLLKTKVSNLIELRRKLQSRYSQEIVLTTKNIAVTNLDEQFLKKVQQVFEIELIEPSFNVEEFSKAIGMSRMQLHRKIKALTGLSASEFIRSQRLKLAAELLKTSDINIAQVVYSVGFNDHSYFAKCFKNAYKCTPTEFAKKHVTL